MRKIVILNDTPQFGAMIQAIAPDWEVVFTKDKASATRELQTAEVVVGWSSVAKKTIEKGKSKIKWVQHDSAGVDSLPLYLLKEKNIIITSASGIHPRPLSESVFSVMLALARNLPTALDFQKKKEWNTKYFENYKQLEIHGKVLGILGTGAIGEEIARIARAFSMRTIGLRRSEGMAPYIDEMYTVENLHTMLEKCDYIVNVLPNTKDTQGIINAEAFAAMRKGARYFAFGRGSTTVTEDLVEALRSGQLSAAGIDVADPEPLPADSPLWDMENVIITPHNSGRTIHYTERLMDIFAENLKSYIETGSPSRNIIDLGKEY